MFVVFICCFALCRMRSLRRADTSSKGVLPRKGALCSCWKRKENEWIKVY
jgi:hypothetical protein